MERRDTAAEFERQGVPAAFRTRERLRRYLYRSGHIDERRADQSEFCAEPERGLRDGALEHDAAEVVDRPLQADFERHLRLPAEERLRLGDVRPADLRIILRQRTKLDRRFRSGQPFDLL